MAKSTTCWFDCVKAFRTCAETTGHHGLNQLVFSKRTPLRFLWAVVIFSAYVMFIFHVCTLIRRYLEHPVTTIIQYKRVPFRFPDVTVCPLTPFSLRLLEFRDENLTLLRDLHDLHTFDSVVDIASFNKHDLFVLCRYNELPCDMTKIDQVDDPLYKHCYRIQSSDDVVLRTKKAENGLSMILFIDNMHTHPLSAVPGPVDATAEWESAGVRLVVHEPGTHPHPFFNGFFIGPGSDAKVALSIEEVQLHPTYDPFNDKLKCIEQRKNVTYCHPHSAEQQSYLETQDDCFSIKVQEHLYRKCGCISDRFDIPCELGDVLHCSAINSSCSGKNLDNIEKIYEEVTGECRSLCSTRNWNARLSTAEWPTYLSERHVYEIIESSYQRSMAINNVSALHEVVHAKETGVDTFELIQKNFVKITVYPETLTGNLIYEDLAYPLGSFLSEVGGILGLWLGCSILTCFEPLTPIFELVHKRKCCSGKRRVTKKASANALSSKLPSGMCQESHEFVKVQIE